MQIVTATLVLRDFEDADWRALHAFESDPEVVRYQSYGPHDEDDSRRYIARDRALQGERPRRVFDLAIVARDEGGPIGRVALRVQPPDDREGVIGGVLHRRFWGQGVMLEAFRAIIDFGFDACGLEAIRSTVHGDNRGAQVLTERIGLRRQSHLTRSVVVKGVRCDVLRYLILRDDPVRDGWARPRRAADAGT